MAPAPHKHPIFLLFVVIPIVCISAFGPETQKLIDTICRQMEDYGFCNKCFAEHITTPNTDMDGLAQIAIEQSQSNASATLIIAKNALSGATDQELAAYLKTCINAYVLVGDLIANAQESFGVNDFNAVLTDFKSSAKLLGTGCGQYGNSHGIPNPLYEVNREERILVTMGLATAYSLLHPPGN